MSKKERIVIVGAGFGGVYTFKALHKRLHGDASKELILVNRENYFLFTPLLHEVATGSIFPENIIEPLRKVVGCCLSAFHMGEVEGIDLENKLVKTEKESIAYDKLILAHGSQTNFFGTKGAKKYSYTLKNIEDALLLKRRFISAFEHASKEEDQEKVKKLLTFAVIGGGPTGVELAAEMAELFYDTFQKYFPYKNIFEHVRIVLINRGDALLKQFAPDMQKKSLERLKELGVEVILNTGVVEVREDAVVFDSGEEVATLTPIWVAGVKPSDLEFSKEVQKERDRIVVNEYFEMVDQKDIYVLGDAAHIIDSQSGKPLPMTAQVATQQGAAVAKAILGEKKKFRFNHKGNLVSLGQWAAIAQISRFHFFGRLAWWFWRTIYLTKLISWQKKFQVAVDWTINLFSPRDISSFGAKVDKADVVK